MGMDLRSWRCGSVVGRGDAHWGGPCLLAFSYFGRFRAHAQTWQVGHPQGDGSLRAGDFLTPIFASPPWKDPNSDTVRCCAFPLEPGESYDVLPGFHTRLSLVCALQKWGRLWPTNGRTRCGTKKMQKGMGGVEQHGMPIMPCTPCSQHGAKKNAEREELYIYIYIIWLIILPANDLVRCGHTLENHTPMSWANIPFVVWVPYSYVITTKHRKHVIFKPVLQG